MVELRKITHRNLSACIYHLKISKEQEGFVETGDVDGDDEDYEIIVKLDI